MTTEALPICTWCGRRFSPRRNGGSRQRFCGQEHRSKFWASARRWGERAVTTGVVSVADIQSAVPAACTLPGAVEAGSLALNQRGSVTVCLDVPAEAVEMLQGAGWISGQNAEGVADAIVDLVDCALACGLRPPSRRSDDTAGGLPMSVANGWRDLVCAARGIVGIDDVNEC